MGPAVNSVMIVLNFEQYTHCITTTPMYANSSSLHLPWRSLACASAWDSHCQELNSMRYVWLLLSPKPCSSMGEQKRDWPRLHSHRTRAATLLFQTFLFSLTLVKFVGAVREGWGDGDLVLLVARDGTWAFTVIFSRTLFFPTTLN